MPLACTRTSALPRGVKRILIVLAAILAQLVGVPDIGAVEPAPLLVCGEASRVVAAAGVEHPAEVNVPADLHGRHVNNAVITRARGRSTRGDLVAGRGISANVFSAARAPGRTIGSDSINHGRFVPLGLPDTRAP